MERNCAFEYYCNGICVFAYMQGSEYFSVKNLRVNILGFAGHMISVATAQTSCCNTKAALDSVDQ